MGRIQANNGIISGIPITETVDQLMKIEARPRDLLVSRINTLQTQQVAITELTATLIGVQLSARKLADTKLYDSKTVTSSQPNLLTATASGAPHAGAYRFTPVRQATAQQLLSSGFATTDESLGAGSFSLQFGGYVNEGQELSALNGGAGVQRGKIRITDRSGASAVVDLRFAQNIDDVLQAINTTDTLQVNAVAVGDHIELLDRSGSAVSNFKVQEVNGGSTAADLGLANIDVASNKVTGGDILKLHAGLGLSQLNDGSGVGFRKELADLNVTLRDGTSLQLDFHRQAKAASFTTTTTTGAADSQISLTAKTAGGEYDGVRITFVDDPGVTAGSETVVYDDSNPANKTLTVHIQAGATTADNVITAINSDPLAGPLFTAARATGSNGSGQIATSDTGVTGGGAAQTVRQEKTLGELLETINATDPTRLKAEISADGDHLVLTDLTADHGGTFAVSSTLGGSLAEDLGLTGAAVGNQLVSSKLQGGLKSTLLKSLNGGQGLGELGAISITDRSGAAATVDLSSAVTLDDVLTAINSAGLGVAARINASRNGLTLVDTTGAVASNVTISSADGNNTAEKLKIVTDSTQTSINSGSLAKQLVSDSTLLSSLRGGQGITRGKFIITDGASKSALVDLTDESLQTVGDVIDAINELAIDVEARLSADGSGFEVVDRSSGSELPGIRDIGAGTTAKELRLTGTAETVDLGGGQSEKVVRGSQIVTINVSETDTLSDVVTKINDLKAGFSAGILSDGSGQTPHRLTIQSTVIGKDGRLIVDSTYGQTFEELVAGRDALLQLGASETSNGILVTSKSNTFQNAVPGLDVTLKGSSTEIVSVTVAQSDSSLVSTAQLFVDNFNKMRDKLASQTFYNAVDNKKGVLNGTLEALRVDTELAALLSGRIFGAGNIHALQELGFDLADDGKLAFDATKLQAKFASDPEGVTKFFTTEKFGFAAKVDDVVEGLAGIKNSLLVSKARSLQDRVDVSQGRVDSWTVRLERRREALLKKFYNLENILGKMQNNISAVSAIQALPPLSAQP